MDQSEIDDYEALLEEFGYEEEDFERRVKELIPSAVSSIGVYPVREKVTITCKRTGVSRTYQGGDRTAWVYAFRVDLKAGVFAAA